MARTKNALHYEWHGAGEPLVLIAGLGWRGGGSWRRWGPALIVVVSCLYIPFVIVKGVFMTVTGKATPNIRNAESIPETNASS